MKFKSKNTPTFWKDGKRRVRCPNPSCGKYLARKDDEGIVTRLTENRTRIYKCYYCFEKFIVYPPKKELNEKGEKVIVWGANAMSTTADLTDVDVDDTMPA